MTLDPAVLMDITSNPSYFFFKQLPLSKTICENLTNGNKWLNNNQTLFLEMKVYKNRDGNEEARSYVRYNKINKMHIWRIFF